MLQDKQQTEEGNLCEGQQDKEGIGENRRKVTMSWGLDRKKAIAAALGLVVLLVTVVIILAVSFGVPSDPTPGFTIYPTSTQHIQYNPYVLENNAYIPQLNDFIQDYKTVPNGSVECDATTTQGPGDSCQFEARWLTTCSEENNWGYGNITSGQFIPCLLIVPNKVVEWVPDVYKGIDDLPSYMPQDLKTQIKTKFYDDQQFPELAFVSCEVVKGGTDGACSLTPWFGFPPYYFPYKADPSYRLPILAARINLKGAGVEKREAVVEFKLWVKNVNPNDTAVRIVMEADPQLN